MEITVIEGRVFAGDCVDCFNCVFFPSRRGIAKPKENTAAVSGGAQTCPARPLSPCLPSDSLRPCNEDSSASVQYNERPQRCKWFYIE